ncbi:MAG: proteasome ATPase, partial [Aeromicrobium sp.]
MSEHEDTRGGELDVARLIVEVEHLRRRLGAEGTTDSRLADLEARLSSANLQNERLGATLREARNQIVTL